MIFKFYCDESHDAPTTKKAECKSYVIGGMFGDEDSWGRIEKGWARKNKLEGVSRYHAAELNGGTGEFEGWSKARRVAYSKEMLAILKKPGRKLHGISIGLYVDEYRKIISSEGQVKMGPPYFVCFKSVLTGIASQMSLPGAHFHDDDQFAMIIDRNGEFETEAIRIFYSLKGDVTFLHRHRLATCEAGRAEEFVGLQAADFVAYEAFKLMHGRRDRADLDMRAPMKSVLGKIGFLGLVFGTDTLTRIKDDVDQRSSVPNGFFVIPPPFVLD